EARDSLTEGFRWLTKTGVWPIFLNARIPPGSVYGAQKANLDKLPPTEFYLETSWAHYEAMKEQDLFRKLNKFGKCGLCHDVAYKGEIGMLELAGDMGNWMADKVPFEMNPKAQFIASLKSPASAR
ncbi:MAG: hypothetical protein Q7O66_22420, partial [Dehalococcoidia bacterium]|nr:hypothetical protein [Dehalococcoidia bacterium]